MTDDDPYAIIARHLLGNIPAGWLKAWIEGEMGEGYSDLLFVYSTTDKERNYFAPSYEDNEIIHDRLVELRDGLQQEGRGKWSRFVFMLQPDGSYHLQLDYDD